jgi:hypothetical protein
MRIRRPFEGKEQARTLAFYRRQHTLAALERQAQAARRGPETDEQTDKRLDDEADRAEENAS